MKHSLYNGHSCYTLKLFQPTTEQALGIARLDAQPFSLCLSLTLPSDMNKDHILPSFYAFLTRSFLIHIHEPLSTYI